MFKLYCFLHVLALFGLVQARSGDLNTFFRKDYVYNANTQSFYKLHTIFKTWTEARSRCKMEGASLFVPGDKQEADYAVGLMKEKNYFLIYIGLQDILSEGEFTTVETQPIEEVYNAWDSGEPNDVDGKEDCVALKSNGKYNDDNCNRKYPFICRKTRATLQWNDQCDSPYKDYKYEESLQKCYKLHRTLANWTEAYAACRAEDSYLAIPDTKEEADHFANVVEKAHLKGFVHLGFHNQFGDGFTTVLGEPLDSLSYTEWAENQPDNAGGTEICGSMTHEGRLNDISCWYRAVYICEHEISFLSSIFDIRFGEDNSTSSTRKSSVAQS